MLGSIKLHTVMTVVEVGVELIELFSGSNPNNKDIIYEAAPAVEEFLEISWAILEEIFFKATHEYVRVARSYSRSHGCAKELDPELLVEFKDIALEYEL